ncbi:conserved hypothetical protein [Ricinus communis]|uniref:Uncharacterized protein n=1 Tax=Ricinus communis TaxID=3988 RepID=B9SZW8_RICCO|nr:conserved hypothetical protein [Ricinus communis]
MMHRLFLVACDDPNHSPLEGVLGGDHSGKWLIALGGPGFSSLLGGLWTGIGGLCSTGGLCLGLKAGEMFSRCSGFVVVISK